MDNLEKFIQDKRLAFDVADAPSAVWLAIDAALCKEDKLRLEKFVQNKRTEFDTAEPPPNLWERIEKELPEKKTNLVRFWPKTLLRIAAAVVFIVLGVGIGIQYEQQSTMQARANQVLSTEQSEALGVFERAIFVKMEEASTTINKNPEIKADLAKLDMAMVELKAELSEVPPGNREQVVHAMLENYRAKVHILERILTHIESQQKGLHKNLNNERTDI